MHGHVVADGDERVIKGDLVRCVRCDAWVPRSSVDPDAKPVPWPRRGKELHQAIVLRLIAVDRAFHALVLIPVGLMLGWLWFRLDVLSPEARNLAEGLAQVSREVGHLGSQLNSVATRVASLDQDHVRNLALLVLAYGIVEGVEAVGLWLEKRWAEYLTVVVTASLLPLEVLELTRHATVLKILTFIVNIAVVVYLVWAKRLFGLRRHAEPISGSESAVAASNPQKTRVTSDSKER
jgi:uncharacterized membrane protein (DUF2068 family)